MTPVRNLRNRAVPLKKLKENYKVPFNSRSDQKNIQLMDMSDDHNELKDPKKTKLDVATLKNCKNKRVMKSTNENNKAYALNKSGKENIHKRNLRKKTEKLPKNKLSVLKENNTNLQNIIPLTADIKRLRENTKTKDQKSIEAKENAKLNYKSDSSNLSGNKKTCNLLQTKVLFLKENSSNIESKVTPATLRNTKNNCKVKKEAKSKTQNEPNGKSNCYRPIDSYFKKPLKENNCVMEGTQTETEVNTVKKFPIWKKLDVSKTDHTKKKQKQSTQDVYDIGLDEDILASSKKSKNTKTRVNHMKRKVKKDKKRLNYPKSHIKTKCTSVKVHKKILGMETQTIAPDFANEKTASEEQNNLPKNTNNDNILNGFHDGNENPNILEQITNNIEITDVHHAENEIQNSPVASLKINHPNEILEHPEQIMNINNIENADVHEESENTNFPAASFEIHNSNEILEHSELNINSIESEGVHNESENLNFSATSFEMNNSSVDIQQSKRIANRKDVTELADELEKSFQIYLTSTPDRSHKNRTLAQKSGIFNVAELSNITVVNNAFVPTPTDSLSDNVAVSTVTNAEINNENNNVSTESSSIVEPPKKKPKKDTADITLFESPVKNDKKKKKQQKPISFYLFQDLEAPPVELEDSVLKPKKTYKEANNFKVHIMKAKRNAAMAKQVAKKQSKVDLLMDSLIKHFDEVANTELCIE